MGRRYDEKNISKDINTTNNRSVVIKNGRYYFLSFIVNTLKEGNDFKNFHYTGLNIPTDIDKLITLFSDIALRAIEKNDIEDINSNLFKSDNLYDLILDECSEEDKKNIKNFFN